MARVSADEVRGIIDDDTSISMEPFIATATTMTNYVNTCDVDNDLTTTQLKEIERWLAAHYYAHRDRQYRSSQTERARATYQVGEEGRGSFDTTQWGKTAMGLDITGCLARLNEEAKTGKKQKVGMVWMGKPVSKQILYQDRD